MKYQHLPTECDLCVESFNAAMMTMDVPIYLHVHPSNLQRAREILAGRDMTPSPYVRGEPRRVEAIADDSIINVNEWYLVTAIGSYPP